MREVGAEIKPVSTAYQGIAGLLHRCPGGASSNPARYDGVRYGLRVEGVTLDEMYENTRGSGLAPKAAAG